MAMKKKTTNKINKKIQKQTVEVVDQMVPVDTGLLNVFLDEFSYLGDPILKEQAGWKKINGVWQTGFVDPVIPQRFCRLKS